MHNLVTSGLSIARMTYLFALELVFLKPTHLSCFCRPLFYYGNFNFEANSPMFSSSTNFAKLMIELVFSDTLSNGYTMGCQPVRGDDP